MAKSGSRGTILGGSEYRQGALERLGDAFILLRDERFAGSIYMAGRGVEGMLRSVVWKKDIDIQQGRKSLETGHDLRQLSTLIGNLGLLQDGMRDDEFTAKVQEVSRLWLNNMRFESSDFVEARWRRIGAISSKRTLKQAARDYYEACSAIIKRCEAL
jgi:hypothetical protein